MEHQTTEITLSSPSSPDEPSKSITTITTVRQSITDYITRWRKFYDTFGLKFIVVAIIIEHIIQGFVFSGGKAGFIGGPIPFIFRGFHLTAGRIQILKTIAISPWALKPMIGMISDTVYIYGYRKIPYIIMTTIGAIISCVIIVFYYPSSPILFTILLFFIFLQISVSDLLIEAKYAEKTKVDPTLSQEVVTFVHAGGYFFQAISIIVMGILLDQIPYQFIYIIPIPIFIIFLFPIVDNWIEDKKFKGSPPQPVQKYKPHPRNFIGAFEWSLAKKKQLQDEPKLTNICPFSRCCWFRNDNKKYNKSESIPIFGFNGSKLKSNKKIFGLATIVGIISLFNSLLGLFEIDTVYLLISSIFCALAMILLFFLMIDHRIAKIQTFIILQNMFSISLDGATFYFYTDTKEQFPAGPHFDTAFYIIGMGVFAIFLAIISTGIYSFFMSKWNYQDVFFMTNVLYIIFSSTNIIFYKRLNVGYIPDNYFVLGSEMLQVVTSLWSSIPATIMMYQLCPKGMESTVFALLAGSSNLGDSLASYQGAYIMDAFDIKPNGTMGIDESKQFENLWIASTIDTLIHIIPLFFITFLIPNVSQSEKLIDDDDDDPTGEDGSIDLLLLVGKKIDEEENVEYII